MSWFVPLEKLKELPPPYEILELKPGEEKRITVVDFEFGKIRIHPRWPGAPKEKWVRCVRLHVPKEEKKYFPFYWDATAGTLVPQLLTILKETGVPSRIVRIGIRKIGMAPKARFSVSLLEIL